jgi:hypothetical protein
MKATTASSRAGRPSKTSATRCTKGCSSRTWPACATPTASCASRSAGARGTRRCAPAHFWRALGLDGFYFALAVMGFSWIFESARNRGLLVKIE